MPRKKNRIVLYTKDEDGNEVASAHPYEDGLCAEEFPEEREGADFASFLTCL